MSTDLDFTGEDHSNVFLQEFLWTFLQQPHWQPRKWLIEYDLLTSSNINSYLFSYAGSCEVCGEVGK